MNGRQLYDVLQLQALGARRAVDADVATIDERRSALTESCGHAGGHRAVR